MKLEFYKSFLNDLTKIKDKKLKRKIQIIILELEKAANILELKNLRKLKGYEYFYRIRIGDYRMGLQIKEDKITFVRFLHRKDIYKHFPKT